MPTFADAVKVMVGSTPAVAVYAGAQKVWPLGPPPVEYNDATGGTITEYAKPDGTYWRVHTFRADGTFTVVKAVRDFTIAIVGGGAPSSRNGTVRFGRAGGGGKGETWADPLAVGSYPLTVGAAIGGADLTDPPGGNPTTAFGHTAGGGNACSAGNNDGGGGWNTQLDIDGTGMQMFGGDGIRDSGSTRQKYGGGGGNGTGVNQWGVGGDAGVVIVSYEIKPPVNNDVTPSGGVTVVDVNNYLGSGKTYRVATFTASGTLSVKSSDKPFNVLTIGGGAGAGGDSGSNNEGSWGGAGGQVVTTKDATLPVGDLTVEILPGGPGGWPGGTNYGGAVNVKNGDTVLYTAAGGQTGPSGPGNWPPANTPGAAGTWSDVSGKNEQYASGGGTNGGPQGAFTVGYGNGGGGTSGHPPRGGGSGAVIIAWEIDAPPFNDATGGTITEIDNYNGTGEKWRVHTFTANGDFTVAAAPQPFAAVVGAGGGGGGQDAQGTPGGRGGHGQGIENLTMTLTPQVYPVVVGGGGAGAGLDGWGQGNGGGGGASSFNGVSASGGGGGHGPGDQNHPQSPSIGSPDGPQITSKVSGADATYGGNGGPPGSRDGGHQQGYDGSPGKVVIAYRVG